MLVTADLTADLTAYATLALALITLGLVIATVRLARGTVDLVTATKTGIEQARADAQAELRVLERQVESSYRPLLVNVLRQGPVPTRHRGVVRQGRGAGHPDSPPGMRKVEFFDPRNPSSTSTIWSSTSVCRYAMSDGGSRLLM